MESRRAKLLKITIYLKFIVTYLFNEYVISCN